MVEPATAAIAVLSTIAGVSGYGAMKINSNQAMVMEELATRLAAEKIEKLRRQQDDALRAKEQQYKNQTIADKQKIAELDRSIADLRADAEKLNADLKQATEGERLFTSVSLPGFKKAIKTFQKQRQASDGDEAMGSKISAAVKKVFDNYTSSIRLNVSRGSMTSLYNDLSKAVGKPYMDQAEFERVLTEILRGVDGSLEGDRTFAEEQRKTEQVTQRTAAAEAAAAELQRRKNEKEAAAAAKKAAAEEAARVKAAQKAEKEAAKAAEAQRKADAKNAATKQASTQIHDALISSVKEALEWYKSTVVLIDNKREKELLVIQQYIPDDIEVKDAIDESSRYAGFLIKYRNPLERKYNAYKDKTKKKPVDESFFEENPQPLPLRELILPIQGGKRIRRRRGGGDESLIALRKYFDVEIDFYRKVRAHVETYMEKLNSLLRRKRAYIQEQGIQDPGKEEEVPEIKEEVVDVKPDVTDETAFNVENPVIEAAKAELEGKTPAPFTMGTQSADKKVRKSLALSYMSPAVKELKTKTRRNRRISNNVSAKNRPDITAELKEAKAGIPEMEARKQAEIAAYEAAQRNPPPAFSLEGGPAAGTGLLPTPPAQSTNASSFPPLPPPVTPGSLPPSLIPGVGTRPQRDATKFGGPLPRYTGGLRKRKLRTRRGGKQKKNVRRTRRS